MSCVALDCSNVALDVLLDKVACAWYVAVLIMYKWLLVGITVQKATFDGEKPESRIRSNVCSSMYM